MCQRRSGRTPFGASRWVSLSSTAEPDSTPAVALAFPASTLFFQSYCTRRIGSQSRHDILTPAPSMTSESITPKRYARPALLFLLAAIAFFVSACEEGEAPASSESDSDSAAPEAESEEVLVEIEFDEYVVYIDAVVPSGPVTLRLVNQGFEEHNLLFVAVESDSTVWETERRLAPGERRDVPLTLEPGAYKAVCNFSGHEDRGMVTEFVVRAAVEAAPPS